MIEKFKPNWYSAHSQIISSICHWTVIGCFKSIGICFFCFNFVCSFTFIVFLSHKCNITYLLWINLEHFFLGTINIVDKIGTINHGHSAIEFIKIRFDLQKIRRRQKFNSLVENDWWCDDWWSVLVFVYFSFHIKSFSLVY